MKISLDLSGLAEQLEKIKQEIVSDINKGVKGLAQATHANIVENVQKGLHSSRDKYLSDLSGPEQLEDGVWCITLKESSVWREDGIPEPYDMKPGLLKDGKTSKDGSKYRVVPMDQGRTPSQLSSGNAGYEQNMIDLVKSTLKKKGIPYKKLELDKNGSPRLGKLHSLDIASYTPGKGNTPQLKGLTIYQTKQKNGSVKRSIMTFRTVTDKPGQTDKWIHPEVEAKLFFDKAQTFSENEWETKWLPMILDKYR